jgi:hypothetical protein
MQNALQNPHYKKIWEKVIMNRHPEAKSLEEALEAELLQKGCVACDTQLGNTMTTIKNNGGTGNYYNQVDILVQRGFDYNNIIRKNNYKPIDIIVIGRPITLEDVLILCKGYFAGINIDVSGIFKFNAIGEPADWSIIPWDFTKPLHEQTPETWEKIANLI